MLGAKRGQPEILESLLDNKQRHASLAGDLMNTAENPTEVVATGIPHDNADRRRLGLHGALQWARGSAMVRFCPRFRYVTFQHFDEHNSVVTKHFTSLTIYLHYLNYMRPFVTV
jgi:hypothetical protein